MDALASFTFLSESLPSWISKLNHLSIQVAERHAEFARLSQPPPSMARKRKTGSTESLRPKDSADNDNSPSALFESPPQAMHVDIDPGNKHLFREVREARRKHRSGSILSGASGAQRYRNRMSTIIYYDSAIQEGFETLVRNIGSARNSLKKGRQHMSFKARVETLRMEEVHSASSGKLRPPVPPIGKIGQQSAPKGHGTPRTPNDFGVEAFDRIDKDLEAAQSLCELGAHQFLRDGDCSDEVEGVKERFESSLRVATEQVRLLNVESNKEIELEEDSSQSPNEPQERGFGTARHDGQFATPGKMYTNSGDTGETPASLDSFPATGTIEVDDESDAGSVHIDLSAFRSARRSWKRG